MYRKRVSDKKSNSKNLNIGVSVRYLTVSWAVILNIGDSVRYRTVRWTVILNIGDRVRYLTTCWTVILNRLLQTQNVKCGEDLSGLE